MLGANLRMTASMCCAASLVPEMERNSRGSGAKPEKQLRPVRAASAALGAGGKAVYARHGPCEGKEASIEVHCWPGAMDEVAVHEVEV